MSWGGILGNPRTARFAGPLLFGLRERLEVSTCFSTREEAKEGVRSYDITFLRLLDLRRPSCLILLGHCAGILV